MIDITGLDRVELLRCLFNRSSVRGMGFLHDLRREMTYADASVIFDQAGGLLADLHLDYLFGRPMKINILRNTIEREDLYDRDNGRGACFEVVLELRTRPDPK